MPVTSKSGSAHNAPLTDELLSKEAAPADSHCADASQGKPSRKQNWKDFLKGLVTGCGVAGV